MQVRDYLNKIFDALLEIPYIESQNISFEERPPNTAYLTGMITFINSSKLYFKEFVVFGPEHSVVLKYGYNYLSKDGALIFRYDNAYDPQAKKLSTYPEHKHIHGNLLAAQRPAFEQVLKEISAVIELLK